MIGKDTIDACYAIRDGLVKEINGRITFREMPKDDENLIVFRLEFKDFWFDYAVSTKEILCLNDRKTVVSKVKKAYENAILKAFFKQKS